MIKLNDIEININKIFSKIHDKCEKTHRDFDEIKLIAVSKTVDFNSVLEAVKYGITDFGENKVQELNQKISQSNEKINFHLIGHLQTNKVKNIIGKVKTIQSVDSLRLTKEINAISKSLNLISDCLIQVNTSLEESKFGLKENELEIFLDSLFEIHNIRFIGLMTIGTLTEDEKKIRNCFKKLRFLKEKYSNYNSDIVKLKELSMGMTNDYEIAIEEGSTMLRIGTAIFGERNYLL